MLPDLARDDQLGILRKMLMIRRAEEHVIRFNEDYEGLIRGHFHVYSAGRALALRSARPWRRRIMFSPPIEITVT